MSSLSLIQAAYDLAVVADKATDAAVHKRVADIVKLHAKIAIASAWIPIPGADLAAMGTNTWTMYARINRTLGIPFSENLSKSLATGVGTNLLSSLPILGVSSVLKAIPGIGTVAGGMLLSLPLYTVTLAAGIVYMRVLAALLKKESKLTEVNLKEAVDSMLKDSGAVKQVIKAANREYRSAKAAGELNHRESLK